MPFLPEDAPLYAVYRYHAQKTDDEPSRHPLWRNDAGKGRFENRFREIGGGGSEAGGRHSRVMETVYKGAPLGKNGIRLARLRPVKSRRRSFRVLPKSATLLHSF